MGERRGCAQQVRARAQGYIQKYDVREPQRLLIRSHCGGRTHHYALALGTKLPTGWSFSPQQASDRH